MLVADLSFGDVYAIRSRTTALIDAQAPNEERRGPRMRLAIVLMLYRRKKLGVVMVRLSSRKLHETARVENNDGGTVCTGARSCVSR